MATGNLIKNISDEATCSLCLEYFKDPVTVDCGHNFCQTCIAQCLEKAEAEPSCPQCRETISLRNFRPSRQLANLVELFKKLQLEKQEEEKWGVCGKHQEPLKLFCKEDRMCICLVCLLSKEHKDHNLVLLEEASQEYKEKLENQIILLGKKRKKLEALRSDEEQKSQNFVTLLEKEKQKCLSAFEKLQEALEENKCVWMSWLDDLQKKKEEYWKENDIELLDKITDLSSQIAEMEKKWQQPAGEFLQDIAKNLNRANTPEDFQKLKGSQELESTLTAFKHKKEAFEKIFRDCQDSLEKVFQEVHVALDQSGPPK